MPVLLETLWSLWPLIDVGESLIETLMQLFQDTVKDDPMVKGPSAGACLAVIYQSKCCSKCSEAPKQEMLNRRDS